MARPVADLCLCCSVVPSLTAASSRLAVVFFFLGPPFCIMFQLLGLLLAGFYADRYTCMYPAYLLAHACTFLPACLGTRICLPT